MSDQNWKPDGISPNEFGDLDTAMLGMHELFGASTKAGFTEPQALQIVALILASGASRPVPKP